MERELDIHPYFIAPEGYDDEHGHLFEAMQGTEEVVVNWLRNLLSTGCTPQEQIPDGYLEDPFVLGFAFSFCGAYNADWSGEKKDADFARNVFIALFGHNRGTELHGRAMDLLGDAALEFVRGAVNGERFHRGYGYPEKCKDDPAFAIAEQRAKEHMEKTRKHIPTGDLYEFTLDKYRRRACYDVYFMDVLRQRYPEKVEWHQTALESLPNPDPDDVDWENLSDEELRAYVERRAAVA